MPWGFEGRGVKGLAFAGALLELEEHFWFDRQVWTSPKQKKKGAIGRHLAFSSSCLHSWRA